VNFYRDFIEPAKQPYAPSDAEREHLSALASWLEANADANAEAIEKSIYDIGRANYDKPGKIFPVIYRTLMGQERGPRLGAFIRLATPEKIAHSLRAALAPPVVSAN
jgi:lysyl-tRNA synthetase class 1